MALLGVCLTLVFVGITGVPAATAENPKLLPGDEAWRDPSFRVFRDRLRDAVRRHDHRFLLSVVHPDIKVGYGGDIGIAGFKRVWNPGNPRSEIWGILDRLLGLGAAFRPPGHFFVPYQFEKWPESISAWDHVVVVVKNAKIRVAPQANAAVIAVVSYDFLKRPPGVRRGVAIDEAGRHPPDDPPGWFKVLAPSGKVGYIDYRSAYVGGVGYRATFTKETGRWMMDFFGSGE